MYRPIFHGVAPEPTLSIDERINALSSPTVSLLITVRALSAALPNASTVQLFSDANSDTPAFLCAEICRLGHRTRSSIKPVDTGRTLVRHVPHARTCLTCILQGYRVRVHSLCYAALLSGGLNAMRHNPRKKVALRPGCQWARSLFLNSTFKVGEFVRKSTMRNCMMGR
jgi:hypothetical protein